MRGNPWRQYLEISTLGTLFRGTGRAYSAGMARTPRKYSTPLVMTFVALVPACGGNAAGSDGSHNVSVNPPPPQQARIPTCTSEQITKIDFDKWAQPGCSVGELCAIPTDCAGGPRVFEFECGADSAIPSGSRWAMRSPSCERPADHCQGLVPAFYVPQVPTSAPSTVELSCPDNSWVMRLLTGNPPAPCPRELPEEGSSCSAGQGFGRDQSACGYFCSSGAWTVVGCVGPAVDDGTFGTGKWISDGACSSDGAGGSGGAGGIAGR